MPISDRDHVIRVTYTDQIPQMPEEGYRHQVAFGFNEEGVGSRQRAAFP
jgi:hypothetical protein